MSNFDNRFDLIGSTTFPVYEPLQLKPIESPPIPLYDPFPPKPIESSTFQAYEPPERFCHERDEWINKYGYQHTRGPGFGPKA